MNLDANGQVPQWLVLEREVKARRAAKDHAKATARAIKTGGPMPRTLELPTTPPAPEPGQEAAPPRAFVRPTPPQQQQQGHRPAGPGGGQFTNLQRGAINPNSMIRFGNQDEMDGTFEYPPVLQSAESSAKFWQNVKVPDLVLDRVSQAYIDRRSANIRSEVTRWDEANPLLPEFRKPLFGAAPPSPNAGRDQAREVYRKEVEAQSPEQLPATHIRPLARVAGMWHNSSDLPPDEMDKLAGANVRIAEQDATVAETVTRYYLDQMRQGDFIDTSRFASAKLTSVVDGLDSVRQEISRLRAESDRKYAAQHLTDSEFQKVAKTRGWN